MGGWEGSGEGGGRGTSRNIKDEGWYLWYRRGIQKRRVAEDRAVLDSSVHARHVVLRHRTAFLGSDYSQVAFRHSYSKVVDSSQVAVANSLLLFVPLSPRRLRLRDLSWTCTN